MYIEIPEGASYEMVKALLSRPDLLAAGLEVEIRVGQGEWRVLTDVLRSPDCLLTDIRLLSKYHYGIGDAGVIALSEALRDPNCKLTYVNLSSNYIGDQGVQALAEVLKDPSCKLLSVDLSENVIGDEGIKLLTDALQHPNCQLTSIFLGEQCVSATGAKLLFDILKSPNCKLESIDLSCNVLDSLPRVLSNVLKHPDCQLTSVSLRECQIGDEGAKVLAETLMDPNCKLRCIELIEVELGDEGVKRLAEALQHPNCKLTSIDLLDNERISDAGQQLLFDACASNLTLLEVRGLQNQDPIERNSDLPKVVEEVMMGCGDTKSQALEKLKVYCEFSKGFAKAYIDLFRAYSVADPSECLLKLNEVLKYGVMDKYIESACIGIYAFTLGNEAFELESVDALSYLSVGTSSMDCPYIVCLLSKDKDVGGDFWDSLQDFLQKALADDRRRAKLKGVLARVAERQKRMGIPEHLILNAFKDDAPALVADILSSRAPNLFADLSMQAPAQADRSDRRERDSDGLAGPSKRAKFS